MTYGELRRRILNLGFEEVGEYAEDPSILVDAINTAMREITNLFPLIGSYRISQSSISPIASFSDSKHYDGATPLVYMARGARSFYVECSGTGELRIDDDDGERVIQLSGVRSFSPYRGFLRGEASLRFSGDFSYDVRNLAFYGEVYSHRLEDIPTAQALARYDFLELTRVDGQTVFLGFLDKVQEGDFRGGVGYRPISDFWVEEPATILLKSNESVDYIVFYRRDFVRFSLSTPESFPIELDADKEHLLPLLAAWYVWQDDEPSKAAKWRNDYEDYKQRLLSLVGAGKGATEDFINQLAW